MQLTPQYMSDSTATRQQQERAFAAQAGLRLGERLRQLRVAAGMTQTALAGDRFSKEYVSQIERGKTRPTRETVEWLAGRLGVDASFLANGVSADERGRVDSALARADALLEARRNDEALAEFEAIRSAVLATGMPELEVRALSGEATVRMRRGEVREAIALLERARVLSEGAAFSDVERSDVLFRLGVARYKISSIQTAIGLFDEALKLAERSEIPSDHLRSNILAWRSRCYRRRRDLEAAREDVERALELAEGLNDKRTAADVYFQASIIADREGHWVLARSYAERAKAAYDEVSEIGNAQLVLGRALLEQDRLDEAEEAFRAGEQAYDQLSSASHRASAWVAQGDLAARRGDDRLAARLYRQAADALQDIRF